MFSGTAFSMIPVIVGRTKAPKNKTNHKHTYTAGFEYKNGTGIALAIARTAPMTQRKAEPRVL
jgi:hypothetical protein